MMCSLCVGSQNKKNKKETKMQYYNMIYKKKKERYKVT